MEQSPGQEVVVASRFLGTVLGEAEMEMAGWLGDLVRARRLRSVTKVVKKAEKQLRDAGIDPKTVPLRTLSPLLEGASLEDEDDEDMLDKWGALLAKAAAGHEIPPGVIQLLEQISPTQARYMDELFDAEDEKARDAAAEKALRGIGEGGFNVLIPDLIRLGLIAMVPDSRASWELSDFGKVFVELARLDFRPSFGGPGRKAPPPQPSANE